MTEWAFLLTPFLVLPIVLLFRFVGCGTLLTVEPDNVDRPPRYRDYIMGEPNNPGIVKNDKVVPNKADVIAYWRLVDTWKIVESASGKIAKDETGFQNGNYVQPAQSPSDQEPTSTTAGSEFAIGAVYSNHYSLIDSDTSSSCHIFEGGYVLVPFKPGLYTDEFTIECWLEADWTKAPGYEHTLFSAGGFYRVPFSPSTNPTHQGFRIFADRDNCWQVQFFTSTSSGNVFASPPSVPLNGKTHLAVTVQKDPANVSGRIVTLYVDGKVLALQTVGFYALADQAPLLIGVGDRANPLDVASQQAYQPVLSPLQEVVLHRKALSVDEIVNHVDINRKITQQ